MNLGALNPLNWFRTNQIGQAKVRGSRWKINNPDPKRHDCRGGSWGHSVSLDNSTRFTLDDGVDAGGYWKCNGHLSPRVRPGDEAIVAFGRGPVVVQFVEVENCRDPADMFFGTAKVLGYLKDLEARELTNELAQSARIQLEGRTPQSHPKQFVRGNGV